MTRWGGVRGAIGNASCRTFGRPRDYLATVIAPRLNWAITAPAVRSALSQSPAGHLRTRLIYNGGCLPNRCPSQFAGLSASTGWAA